MSLKRRAVFGTIMTALLLGLVLLAPDRETNLDRISIGVIGIFWVNFAYAVWRERRNAKVTAH
jgi:hypothetical protein